MRHARSFARSLAPTIVLLATACDDDRGSPLEPSPAEPAAAAAPARWADGYAFADRPTQASYTPAAASSYNRGGGAIRIQRVAGATGRYVVTFTGLSAILGTKSTVHVTAQGSDYLNHCKPVNGHLANDKVEVRCHLPNGTPVNGEFSVIVLGKSAARAFAFGHQPASAGYAPKGAGSWNPTGATRVTRLSPGFYEVTFAKLGSRLQGKGGHAQVGAVGTGTGYCKVVDEWTVSPDVKVRVQCYAPGGVPADAKFNVLFALPAPHVAYAYMHILSGTSSGDPFWTWNPSATPGVTFNRVDRGHYAVSWTGVDPAIIDIGTAHVTAVGMYDNAVCKIDRASAGGALVLCYAANGTLVDVPFTVLLGS